jgi:N-acetylglutamate synthase-like GNAT family acetyltransferase
MPELAFGPTSEADFEDLLALRIEVMRESLERLGRFDPQRARERLRAGFDPLTLRRVLLDGQPVGCVALKPEADAWRVDQFYLRPATQGRGVGSAVMRRLIGEATAAGQPLRVAVLRLSDANRFYQRHGFVQVSADQLDIEYLRPL